MDIYCKVHLVGFDRLECFLHRVLKSQTPANVLLVTWSDT